MKEEGERASEQLTRSSLANASERGARTSQREWGRGEGIFFGLLSGKLIIQQSWFIWQRAKEGRRRGFHHTTLSLLPLHQPPDREEVVADQRRGRIIIVDDTVVVKGANGADCRQGGPLFVGGEPT